MTTFFGIFPDFETLNLSAPAVALASALAKFLIPDALPNKLDNLFLFPVKEAAGKSKFAFPQPS